jgi:hypothetical protein
MSDDGWEDVPDESTPLTVAQVQDHFVKKGYKPHHAAGIAANLVQESGLNPNAVNSKSGAEGLAQWLGPRKSAFHKYAKDTGGNAYDPMVQLDFVDRELNSTESKAKTKLLETKNSSDAAVAFSDHFERAGENEKNNARRVDIAQNINSQEINPQNDSVWEDVPDWEGSVGHTPRQEGEQMANLSYPELAKNAALGMAGRFEEAAAGLAGPLAPQSWRNKIAAQNEWKRTHAGSMYGDIAADTAMTLPLAAVAPASLPASAGTLAKLVQPLKQVGLDTLIGALYGGGTKTEGRTEEAAAQGLGSGLFSATGQLVKPIAKGIGYTLNRLSNKYPEQQVSELLQGAVHDKYQVAKNLQDELPLIKDYNMTAAEAGHDYGLNALQKHAEGVNPGTYGAREAENILARKAALDTIAGTPEAISIATGKVDRIMKPKYDAVKAQSASVNPPLATLLQRPSMKEALDIGVKLSAELGQPISAATLDAVKNAKPGTQINGEGIHVLKIGLDEMLKDAKSPLTGKRRAAHIGTINDFKNWRETNIPDYNAAQTEYAKRMKPINKKAVGLAVRNATYPQLSNFGEVPMENKLAFAEAITKDNLVKTATGMNSLPIEKVLARKDIKQLDNIAKNMSRSQKINFGAGGDFSPGHEGMFARIVGGLGGGIGPGAYQALSSAAEKALGSSNKVTKELLATTLLDPAKTRQLLLKEPWKNLPYLDNRLANRMPGLLGQLFAQNITKR